MTWAEFTADLEEKVRSLDGLYEAHMKYLQKAFFRYELSHNKEAAVSKCTRAYLRP